MNKELKRNIMLGLFITAGIIIFIIGIFLVGSRNELFTKTFSIRAVFNNASGLKTGCIVRFNGVKVGIVKSVVNINDSMVMVDIHIEEVKRALIKKSAVATIATDGLMGNELINITNGNPGSPQAEDNDFIQSRNSINTDQVMVTLTQSNRNIKEITENLKILTGDLNSKKGTLQELYEDPDMAASLKQAFNNLNLLTAKMVNVGTGLQQITSGVQNGKGPMGEILNDTYMAGNLSHSIAQFKNVSDKLNSLSDKLSETLASVNSGEGTVHVLLTDTALASNIKQSVINIKNASDNLNQNMEALKHNVFFRGYFRKLEKGNNNKQAAQ